MYLVFFEVIGVVVVVLLVCWCVGWFVLFVSGWVDRLAGVTGFPFRVFSRRKGLHCDPVLGGRRRRMKNDKKKAETEAGDEDTVEGMSSSLFNSISSGDNTVWAKQAWALFHWALPPECE